MLFEFFSFFLFLGILINYHIDIYPYIPSKSPTGTLSINVYISIKHL